MPRPIDHLVLAVPDLAAAMDLYGALGFTVGARNRHPWGTENAIVQLDGAFLELIGLGAGFIAPASNDPAAPFAEAVAAAVARGGGLAMLAMGSTDADADAASFAMAGVGKGRRLDFGRTALGPDGTRREVRFGLAFVDDPALPEAGLFTCRHHRAENFWNPAAQVHANGARRLEGVVLAADAPERHVPLFRTVCGVPPSCSGARWTFATATGRIHIMPPADARARYGAEAGAVPGRFAAFGTVVDSLDPVRACLDAASLPRSEIAGALVVPAASAYGVALAFAPGACHSHP